ncbi:EamA family transporter [Leptolyngbya sp. BL0902]|uniref:DMT family transporter n=1 Tax=Leptolyngbya sp. BL0902 TaxID=1115757 RepID=UPI0019378B37|nr:DMT family transporter [Leptolyngbya sp. BL0902]QQE65890.1 EamA family transporter [Leptolyngbya sp. BL0902]
MGPNDHLPNDPSLLSAAAANEAMRGLSQDLEALRQKISAQLADDITYLQTRKQRLMADIETLEDDFSQLKAEYQALRASQGQLLSEQQMAQQQVWAKRLAQALATHLQARLTESLLAPGVVTGGDTLTSFTEASERLSALDQSLHSALKAIQQDLQGYQSSLSQQVSRMHSMEQQGEAILEALVTRLSQQLQGQMVQPQRMPSRSPAEGALLPSPRTPELPTPGLWGRPPSPWPQPQRPTSPLPASPRNSPVAPQGSRSGPSPTAGAPPAGAALPSPPRLPQASPTPGHPTPPAAVPSRSQTQAGLILVILSTLALSIHNVLVGLIGFGGQVFGQIPVAAIFPLSLPNSLLLLWLRMVVVVPLMVVVAQRLRPTVGQEIGQVLSQADRRPLMQVVASGSFLFLSQVLIYKAISEIGPGVAVTLLFMYPLITVPLAWALFGDRPTPLRLVVMVAITMGIVFTALPRISSDLSTSLVSPWGVGAALLSSVAFALYLVAMQLSFRRLHPVPVSLMQFSTVFVLTSVILIGGSFVGIQPSQPASAAGLYVGGLMLGFLTLLGYLFNNYGVKLMGAAQASIVAASGPVVTAVLAYVVLPGEKSSLQFIQWMGVVLVTLGVVSLSLERLITLQRAARRSDPA